MAPANSKAGSSVSSASSSKERSLKLKGALARGNALRKLKKDPQDPNISLETLLLPDNNEMTLGSLMTSENLSYAQAIEVFLQFEHENEQAKNAEPEEHEELELPTAAKKPKAKAAPPKDPKKDEETPASKRKRQTPNEKPTSKKSKSATTEAPADASTADCEKPARKKGNTSKAEAPAEASTACKKPAGKKSKSTEAEAPAEPSTTRKEKPTSKKSKSTPPPSEPTPTDPSEMEEKGKKNKAMKKNPEEDEAPEDAEHPEAAAEPEAPAPALTTKKLKKKKKKAAAATAEGDSSGVTNKRPATGTNAAATKIRKLKATEDLASADPAADQDDAGDKQLDDGLDEMIKCIDEKDVAPGTPPIKKKRRHSTKRPATPSAALNASEAEACDDGDAVDGDGEAPEEPWSQDRQPDDPAMLKMGW